MEKQTQLNETNDGKQIKVVAFEDGEIVFFGKLEKFPALIGRIASSDIVLNKDNEIRDSHLLVRRQGEHFFIDDLSREGFKVNEVKASEIEIEDGVDIEIGRLRLHFALEQGFEDSSPKILPSGELLNVDLDVTKENLIKGYKPKHRPGPKVPVEDEVTELITKSIHVDPLSKSPFIDPPSIEAKSPLGTEDYGQEPLYHGEIMEGDSTEIKDLNEPESEKTRIEQLGQATKKALGLQKIHLKKKKREKQKYDLRVTVKWKGKVFDTKVYRAGERVSIGRHPGYRGIYIPFLPQTYTLASFEKAKLKIRVPVIFSGLKFTQDGPVDIENVGQIRSFAGKKSGRMVEVSSNEKCVLNLGHDTSIRFEYIPSRDVFRLKFEPDEDFEFKETAVWSWLVHTLLMILLLMAVPASQAPEIDNVPERYAKLLRQPPKVLIKKKVVKKPKKKVIKKPQKIQARPKKVVVKRSQKIKKLNKFPLKLKSNRITKKPAQVRRIKPTKKPVQVKDVGALGVLGKRSSSRPTKSIKPVTINPNKNAGGRQGPSASGVIGLVKSRSGKLSAGGLGGRVRTKGKGFGSGQGYGVQGIRGMSGKRQIAGAVIGSPKLMKVSSSEGLSRKQVMSIVKKHVGKIQQCYERALLKNSSLSGRVEYEWEITPRGKVSSVRVIRSKMAGGDSLNQCVFRVFKRMRFPRAKNGQATVPRIGFPFGQL